MGGIGSGKSTVGRMLSAWGAEVIDADEVGRQLLNAEAVLAAIARSWPDVVVDGAIDRQRLADRVFEDELQLSKLESITHPEIRNRIGELVEGSEADVVVVEMPILRGFVDRRWFRVVVDVPDGVRVERLRLRGMNESDIRSRMSHQPTRVEWLGEADFVLDNSGEADGLVDQVAALIHAIEESCQRQPLAGLEESVEDQLQP
jgi:dephospho-CoA kinase